MPSPLPTPALDPHTLADDPVVAVRGFVERRRAWFAAEVAGGAPALPLCHQHAAAIDAAVAALFARALGGRPSPGRFAVLALGGYGRREMGLFCDIDLLFLHDAGDEAALREITDGILYPFWDNGIEVGGATRTIADCRAIIAKEIKAFTAMTEARPVCGDAALAAELAAVVGEHLADRRERQRFIRTKRSEMLERLARFGDSIYLLQPNVKEGEGGLRDYHTLAWLARAAYGGDALARAVPPGGARLAVDEALNFLWRVRHALHLIEGKRADRLSETLQPPVAEMLGYRRTEEGSAAEALMSDYYRHAIELHVQCERAIERILREAQPVSRAAKLLRRRRLGRGFLRTEHRTLAARGERFRTDPVAQLEMFAAAKRAKLPLDAEAKELVVAAPAPVDDAARRSAAAAGQWRRIFATLPGLDRTLAEMMECGLLARWFPEMEPMLHRVQHDGFHFYTAGVHSVRAVGELVALARRDGRRIFPAAPEALALVARPAVLAAATLLHDVGKGRGPDHAATGATLAGAIARRVGFDDRDAEEIAFLVRSHLLMTLLAFRRDVRDPALVGRFAQAIRSPEMLAMLTLLTVADLRAVGPHIWSDWKGGLLAELFHRTLDHFEKAGQPRETGRRERARRIAAIRRLLGRGDEAHGLEAFLARLPERYLDSIPPETVAAHAVMARGAVPRSVATAQRPIPERGCTELSVVTRDAPGLFAKIAGVLTANGANIIDAQLFTAADGVAIDVFWMTDAAGKPLADPEQWARIRQEMEAAIAGEKEIDAIVGHRFKRRLLSWGQRHRAPEIVVDNDVSAAETVVEVGADDRLGLLYTIAATFAELGCSIERARITTHVDRVIDVFYIRDAGGGKIVDRERLERIRRELWSALEE